ncbi:FG-GAP repeat domain-containing protein [Streptomyces sp. NPDC001404]|uniref:FG-GAP repeat domain-containing protein n=1 Tax=Streptomyces sp. NPDC001404 TaxID=3364571 RepID=UPI00368FC52F
MARLPGRTRRRALSRLATAAIAAALVGTTAGIANADPAPSHESRAESPRFPLLATDGAGALFEYLPDGHGGFGDRKQVAPRWRTTATVQVDLDQNGLVDSHYFRTADGSLYLAHLKDNVRRIGGGWDIYNRLLSPGDLTGSGTPSLLARDKTGDLWIYQARPDGTLTDRVRVGPGWDIYTDIVGRGDLNGDGHTDIVAKDRNGVLWFYKGTGNINDPFESRVRIGGGWDAYDMLVSSGDVNLDGRSDLLARDHDGVLWLYKGNGNQNDPFDNRVRIGGGWDEYTNLF